MTLALAPLIQHMRRHSGLGRRSLCALPCDDYFWRSTGSPASLQRLPAAAPAGADPPAASPASRLPPSALPPLAAAPPCRRAAGHGGHDAAVGQRGRGGERGQRGGGAAEGQGCGRAGEMVSSTQATGVLPPVSVCCMQRPAGCSGLALGLVQLALKTTRSHQLRARWVLPLLQNPQVGQLPPKGSDDGAPAAVLLLLPPPVGLRHRLCCAAAQGCMKGFSAHHSGPGQGALARPHLRRAKAPRRSCAPRCLPAQRKATARAAAAAATMRSRRRSAWRRPRGARSRRRRSRTRSS